jgi:SpoVK/Ycf46/Vps4 family AAA+-type ATPase
MVAELLDTTVDNLYWSGLAADQGKGGLVYEQEKGVKPLSKAIKSIGALPFTVSRFGSSISLRESAKGIRHVKVSYQAFSYQGPWQEAIVVRKQDYRALRTEIVRYLEQFVEKTIPPILQEGLLEDLEDFVINYRRNWREYKRWGARTGRGLLLDGPPGNGKTMICKYLQKRLESLNYTWNVASMGEIDRADAGGELDDLLNNSDVIFLDDIDIAYLNRHNDGRRACALLTAMDGPRSRPGVVRIFTTNEAVNNLDAAFLRPGRIDRIVTIYPPDKEMRIRLFKAWPEEIQAAFNVEELADETEGMNFAEVELVRSLMVDNFMKNGVWDIKAGLANFIRYREQDKNNSDFVGFGGK